MQCGLFYMRGRGFDETTRLALQQRIRRMHILSTGAMGYEQDGVFAVPYASRFHYDPGVLQSQLPPQVQADRDNANRVERSESAGRQQSPRKSLQQPFVSFLSWAEERNKRWSGPKKVAQQGRPASVKSAAWQPGLLAQHKRPLLFSYTGLNSRGRTFKNKSWDIKRRVRCCVSHGSLPCISRVLELHRSPFAARLHTCHCYCRK